MCRVVLCAVLSVWFRTVAGMQAIPEPSGVSFGRLDDRDEGPFHLMSDPPQGGLRIGMLDLDLFDRLVDTALTRLDSGMIDRIDVPSLLEHATVGPGHPNSRIGITDVVKSGLVFSKLERALLARRKQA